MAEVGLVRFAQVAREVAEAVLPTYRSKYSKHLFTQPTLLAILCLMRYEDWTFREAEVRLGEHQELRAALGLEQVPDLHDPLSLPAALGWGGGVARADSSGGATAAARSRGHGHCGRCHGIIPDGSKPLLRRPHAQSGR